MKGHIFLIGFMGVGKTSTAKELSHLLSVEELDTDQMIVEQEKKSIPQIFTDDGEEAFRQIETGVIKGLADRSPAIISCGGGVVLRQENVDEMKRQGKILLLTATPETIFERVRYGVDRPLLEGHMNVEYIEKLLKEREGRYKAATDLCVATDGMTAQEVAAKIAAMEL